jgi:hypothetical protein
MHRAQIIKWVRAACMVVCVAVLFLLGMSMFAYRNVIADKALK